MEVELELGRFDLWYALENKEKSCSTIQVRAASDVTNDFIENVDYHSLKILYHENCDSYRDSNWNQIFSSIQKSEQIRNLDIQVDISENDLLKLLEVSNLEVIRLKYKVYVSAFKTQFIKLLREHKSLVRIDMKSKHILFYNEILSEKRQRKHVNSKRMNSLHKIEKSICKTLSKARTIIKKQRLQTTLDTAKMIGFPMCALNRKFLE